MRTLTVNTFRPYEIQIEGGLLCRAGELCRAVLPGARKLAVVTDSNVAPLYLEQVADSLETSGFQVGRMCVPAGEDSKCVQQLERLWEGMMELGLTRTDGVVALGGGVVGDLAGFAAATVLRGVDFIQIPTTLLAQVDSSVGGKVAIDLKSGKNLAGAFWQPRLVLMDPDCLKSLPDRVFSDGMAEVIKYGCIADRDFFNFLRAHPSREKLTGRMEEVLYACCNLKRRVVEEDERDTGARMTLNFGHTVGHAFEKLGSYRTWTHGQGVAAGMGVALRMGRALGIGGREEEEQALTDLLEGFGLPTRIDVEDKDWGIVAETVGLDKKSSGDEITMIFLKKIGKAVPVRMKKETALEQLAAVYGRA